MLGDVSFENIQKSLVNFHIGFDFENFLFCGLILDTCDSTELKPSIIVFTITKFSQHYVNCAPIIRKKHIMRNAKLNKFVSDESKHKR